MPGSKIAADFHQKWDDGNHSINRNVGQNLSQMHSDVVGE